MSDEPVSAVDLTTDTFSPGNSFAMNAEGSSFAICGISIGIRKVPFGSEKIFVLLSRQLRDSSKDFIRLISFLFSTATAYECIILIFRNASLLATCYGQLCKLPLSRLSGCQKMTASALKVTESTDSADVSVFFAFSGSKKCEKKERLIIYLLSVVGDRRSD